MHWSIESPAPQAPGVCGDLAEINSFLVQSFFETLQYCGERRKFTSVSQSVSRSVGRSVGQSVSQSVSQYAAFIRSVYSPYM